MSNNERPLTAAWPATEVEMRRVSDLKPARRNARTHSRTQVQQLASGIERFGWTIPVLVDESGELIAGHGRVQAAKLLGIAEVPAMVARGWSEDMRRAYMIADNKLALNADWDMELLRGEVIALEGTEFAPFLGFSEEEVEALHDLGAPEEVGGAPAEPDPDGLLTYALVFDSQDQQATWFEFLKYLRGRFPDEAVTVAARVTEFIRQFQVREGLDPGDTRA